MYALQLVCLGKHKSHTKMTIPPDHPDVQNQLKEMKHILIEYGLWDNKLCMECKTYPEKGTACCAKYMLELQPDFNSQ